MIADVKTTLDKDSLTTADKKDIMDNVLGIAQEAFDFNATLIELEDYLDENVKGYDPQKFIDEKVNTWNDGKTVYMAYRKKKTVEIHDAQSDKKDKYSGKFKFTLDDFDYAIAEDGDDLLLMLKQKRHAKGSIKEVQAWVKRGTLTPLRLRIKVAFIWTTVKISNFRHGGISDDIFVFPRKQYKDWKFIDKR